MNLKEYYLQWVDKIYNHNYDKLENEEDYDDDIDIEELRRINKH